MEYVYVAMLLHKAGKEINESNVKKVLEAAGIKAEEAKVKVLIAALQGVDIEKAIKESLIVAAPTTEARHEAKPEKKAEDEKKTEEAAAAGLGALFG